MRSGANSVQHLLTPAALGVLKHAVTEARRRGHPQVQPLHVVSMLLTHAGSRLRQACMLSHPQNSQTAECRALEVCFNVALDHLPQSAMAATSQPTLSNALMAALKRAHAHQRRGCPEHQQSPLLAVKVEIDQLIISILDDPSVSRVMKEAGFSSTNVKFNLEDGPATVTVASGVTHTLSGHEQPSKHGMDLVSQGPFYDSSCVTQDENETKSPVKFSPVVMNQANSTSSWQYPEVSLEGHESREVAFRVSNTTHRVVGPAVDLPSREEDVRNILDIFLRPRNRNAILIGDVAVGANSAVEDLALRIKNGNVPLQLQGLQFLDPKLSSSSFGYCSSLEMEQKLAELSKIVDECMPVGAILHIGDLQWLAEPMQLKKGPSNFCPAQRTASVLRQLLIRHANNRLWFVGVATPHIFVRLQALYPSLTADWGLEPVQITTIFPSSQPTFLHRFANNLLNVNDLPSMNVLHSRAGSPMVASAVQDVRHVGANGVAERFPCCTDCHAKFEEERRLIHENESLSLQLAPVKWFSLSSDEATSGGANGAMTQAESQSVVQHLTQLQQKWQKTCRMLHGEPPMPGLTQARTQTLSPITRLSATSPSKPCGLGMDISSRWSSPENRQLGSSVVDQPLRTPSNSPMYTMNAARQGLGSPLRSAVQVQEASSVGGNKSSEAACGPDLGSPKDGSSVASAPEDHEDPNGSTGTSVQDASLAPIHTNLALGRANDVCSGLMAGKLRVPKPVTQPSPLQSVGASPMSLKNSGKPSWLVQSPLQQRRPAATDTSQGGLSWQSSPSPMAKRQIHVAKSPSPPPALKEVIVDDNLKGLYKGLMQRVPWQSAAVAGISSTVMKCRSGMGAVRGATAKTDTWLLLLGPDPVAKHAIAKALAELVFGGERSLLHLGFGDGSLARLEADDNGMRYRGRTPLDRLAEAVRMKPSAVILLEDIDKANSVMRASIVRAMERGKLADSSGREVSFSNTIVVMTTSVGSECDEPKQRSGSLSFSEGKLTALGRTGIRAYVKDSGSDKVIFQAPHSKIAVVDHGERQSRESVEANHRSPVEVPFWVPKRKPDSLLQSELRPKLDGKRTKSGEGRFLNLDLNLATGESEGNCWSGETQTTWADDDEEAKSEKVLAKARIMLSDKFCALPDYAVGFHSYDFNGLATEIMTKLGKSFENHAPCGVGVELELGLLEHIMSCVWKMPGGRQAFNTWVDEVFSKSVARSLGGTHPSGGSVVEFVADMSEVKYSFDGVVALPHSIAFGPTLAVCLPGVKDAFEGVGLSHSNGFGPTLAV